MRGSCGTKEAPDLVYLKDVKRVWVAFLILRKPLRVGLRSWVLLEPTINSSQLQLLTVGSLCFSFCDVRWRC